MISTQFLQNCQSGDENAIETLVRTHQRGVFQLALSILDDAPMESEVSGTGSSDQEPGAETAGSGQKLAVLSADARAQASMALSEAAEQAELATRETFSLALDRLGRYREDTSFTTWLYGIAIEVARRRMRVWKLRRWWWKILGRHVAPAWYMVTARGQNEGPRSPMDGLYFLPGDIEMWSAVRGLDEKLRIPVVLRYYHDFPIVEIAQLLHMSEGAVHARLDAARERIAVSLEK